jgi:hypothetical protein
MNNSGDYLTQLSINKKKLKITHSMLLTTPRLMMKKKEIGFPSTETVRASNKSKQAKNKRNKHILN